MNHIYGLVTKFVKAAIPLGGIHTTLESRMAGSYFCFYTVGTSTVCTRYRRRNYSDTKTNCSSEAPTYLILGRNKIAGAKPPTYYVSLVEIVEMVHYKSNLPT